MWFVAPWAGPAFLDGPAQDFFAVSSAATLDKLTTRGLQ